MTTNRELNEILAEIGREHRAVTAPEKLEAVLFAAADKKPFAVGSSGFRWSLVAVAILIVAVATAGTIWQSRKKAQPENQHAQSAPVTEARVRAEAALPSATVAEKKRVIAESARAGSVRAERSRTNRASQHGQSQKPHGWNSLDEFVALPASEGLAPAADLSVVRVKLRGSDLQQYGLEAPVDAAARTMLAEFVIGEDGLPRAIRIVQ